MPMVSSPKLLSIKMSPDVAECPSGEQTSHWPSSCRCSPVRVLAQMLVAAHGGEVLTRLPGEYVITRPRPSPPLLIPMIVPCFFFSFRLWESVFSHSPKPQLRATMRKSLTPSVCPEAVGPSQGVRVPSTV